MPITLDDSCLEIVTFINVKSSEVISHFEKIIIQNVDVLLGFSLIDQQKLNYKENSL